ncbi:hypothetical protein H1R20_g931, partial [Candolleomyces eurysporus]
MIIFRVTTGRSFTKFPSVKDGIITNPIRFARRTGESSFLRSTLNREFGRNGDADAEQGLNSSIGVDGDPNQTQTSVIHAGQKKRNDGGATPSTSLIDNKGVLHATGCTNASALAVDMHP